MAAPADLPSHEPPLPLPPPPPHSSDGKWALFKRFLGGRENTPLSSATYVQDPEAPRDSSPTSGFMRRFPRKVVPGLPRAQTFKRQQSEIREKLEPIQPTPAERRAVSVDRRLQAQRSSSQVGQPLPRASAPDFLDDAQSFTSPPTIISQVTSAPQSPTNERQFLSLEDVNYANIDHRDMLAPPTPSYQEAFSPVDLQSTTTSQYDQMINDDLEQKWILNLSMHFRDKSKREKFFVTYREKDNLWRRVTISLDYRNAEDDSLEKDLLSIKFQREKSAKIYEAIRESLQDIQFYPTVTNLKLQTTDGRLHVHVVEDVNEIINYPTPRMVQHMRCRRIRERDLEFDSHMSGFVYKVQVHGLTLIKKEIPGPDTVDEFLYEVNALNSLRFSRNVIEFYGVVVDDDDEYVKGLLINYAEKGALIDVIYDSQEQGAFLPWVVREKWARQIVQGLSDVHEAGFVQGDLTLSNIVIDDDDNAKIIDINRRGCPVGWEPPEATPLIDSSQRISMYIGVKSDLYQLGMVLWALATLEDEPEAHRRPLHLSSEIDVPDWYRRMVEICLHENPRMRRQATSLLEMFPEHVYEDDFDRQDLPSISVDDGCSFQEYLVDRPHHNGHPHIRTVQPPNGWPYTPFGHTNVTSPGLSDVPYYYPPRGRSPPRPLLNDYTNMHAGIPIWPGSTVDLPASDSGLEEERAETPKKIELDREMNENQRHELEQFRADADQAAGDAQITGDENQTEKRAVAIGATQAHEAAIGHAEKNMPPSDDDGRTTSTPVDDPTPTEGMSETHAFGNLDSDARNVQVPKQMRATGPEGTEYIGGKGPAAEVVATPQSPRSDGETESLSNNNYTHDRIGGNTATRLTEAFPSASTHHAESNIINNINRSPPGTGSRPSPPLPRDLPAELTGVGSAYDVYDVHEEYRQPICSDEDLGLTTTTTTKTTTTTTSIPSLTSRA
ncbi:hypothetical protein F5B20DRAFT_381643 [Whalleya microplaca]|nr:hypothetical protein F5B20DRAFT_381643 [Whalleya microplaca]